MAHILYWTSGGATESICNELEQHLHSISVQVTKQKIEERQPKWGQWFRNVIRTSRRTGSDIEEVSIPSGTNVLVVAGPVWNWTCPSVLRSALECIPEFDKTAVVIASCGSNPGDFVAEVQRLLSKSQIVASEIATNAIKRNPETRSQMLNRLIEAVKSHL
ncbi:hypothetical protein RCL1_002431 [Eukaryota sp. TZLM3-RCL]